MKVIRIFVLFLTGRQGLVAHIVRKRNRLKALMILQLYDQKLQKNGIIKKIEILDRKIFYFIRIRVFGGFVS